LREAVPNLLRNTSYGYALVGIALYAFFGYGASIFVPSYMMRTLHASLVQASSTFGVAISVATGIGAVGGGWLADRLGQRDIRWYGRLPAMGCAIAIPRLNDFKTQGG
jgi:predicted MFS family arabinose efflux permease